MREYYKSKTSFFEFVRKIISDNSGFIRRVDIVFNSSLTYGYTKRSVDEWVNTLIEFGDVEERGGFLFKINRENPKIQINEIEQEDDEHGGESEQKESEDKQADINNNLL